MNSSSEDNSKTSFSDTIGPTHPETLVSFVLPELDAMLLCPGCTESYMDRMKRSELSNPRKVAPDAQDAPNAQDAPDTQDRSTQTPDVSSGPGHSENDTTRDEHRSEDPGGFKDLDLTAEFLLLANLVSAVEALPLKRRVSLFPRLPEDAYDDVQPEAKVRLELFSFKVGNQTFTALSVPIPISELNKPTRPGWQWCMFICLVVSVGLCYLIVEIIHLAKNT